MFLEPFRSRNFKKRKNIKSKRKDLKIFAFFIECLFNKNRNLNIEI